MSQDVEKLCRRYRLNYVETADLRLRRRRCGKGFAYIDADGGPIRDKLTKARIKQLAIPPAWTGVCIAEDERAHIQAVGRDAEGRLQYRYHTDWDKARSETKAQRLLRLGTVLPRLRGAVRKALSGPELTRTKVIAAVVRLIDRALLRPGYEEYAEARGSRGAATLLKSDVSVQGNKVLIEFEGKGGKPVKRELKDKLLAPVVKKLSSLKGRRLFSAPDGSGQQRPVTAREVNAFIAEASGADVTAKDFRTFRASAEALATLTENNGHETEKLRKQAIIEAADKASEILVNTRTVARSSYIHASVIKAYESGKLETSLFRGRLRSGLNRIESALMRFLERKSGQPRQRLPIQPPE
jgi:DNA topoisomerase I